MKIDKAKTRMKLFMRVFWSWRSDLNRRPADYESAALPTEPLQQETFNYMESQQQSLYEKTTDLSTVFPKLFQKAYFAFLSFFGSMVPPERT